MIKTLEFRGFRGIESVSFHDLGRVNLVVGGNNTGKTSVLEAMVLLFGDQNQVSSLPSLFRQSASKDDDWNNFWPLLASGGSFEEFALNTEVTKIRPEIDKDGRVSLYRLPPSEGERHGNPIVKIEGKLNGHVDAGHSPTEQRLAILSTAQPNPATTSNLFNEIAPLNPDNETRLEDLLRRSIEPRLRRLRYAKPKGSQKHLVYVDLGTGPMIPFTQMGQAFARTLHIYCEIFALNPDILIVDEIENGLYYGGLEDFWKGLIAVLEDQQVQLFATTHSRECMEAAVRGNRSDNPAPLRYLRLDRKADDPDKIVGSQFDQKTMATALEFGQEMR
ncbi:MAG: AAA family ATPase [Opitutales bacterium]